MKKIFSHPLLLLTIICLLGYIGAEFLIRGDALNQISGGVAGYVLWGGVALLIFCWVIWPICSYSLFPEWIEPESLGNLKEKICFFDRYSNFLIKHFGKNAPEIIAPDIEKLISIKSLYHSDPARRSAELEILLPQIHDNLSEELGHKIITSYMKKAGLMTCISQHGWLDSGVMFYMQFRMLIDLSKFLGYRPSWYFVLKCFCWIIINSILFALFDETDVLEEAFEDLLPYATGEAMGKSLPLVGKAIGSLTQGVLAMGVIWGSGKIITNRLLGNHKRLSAQERINYRLEGYKKAGGLIKDIIGKKFFSGQESGTVN